MILESLKTAAVVVGMHVFAILAPRIFGPGSGPINTGEIAACAAVGIVFALNALGYMVLLTTTDGLPLGAQLAEVVPPLVACGPMVIAVVALDRTLSASMPAAILLSAEVILGALTFVPSAFVLAPSASRELVALLLATLRTRRRQPAVP
jgi:PST family polysaccharide transporter